MRYELEAVAEGQAPVWLCRIAGGRCEAVAHLLCKSDDAYEENRDDTVTWAPLVRRDRLLEAAVVCADLAGCVSPGCVIGVRMVGLLMVQRYDLPFQRCTSLQYDQRRCAHAAAFCHALAIVDSASRPCRRAPRAEWCRFVSNCTCRSIYNSSISLSRQQLFINGSGSSFICTMLLQ